MMQDSVNSNQVIYLSSENLYVFFHIGYNHTHFMISVNR